METKNNQTETKSTETKIHNDKMDQKVAKQTLLHGNINKK